MEKMPKDNNLQCPCSSGKPYVKCCAVYHQGKEPETAVVLMRSRFSAYAMNNVDYILRTTHPRHPPLLKNPGLWKEEILKFSINTCFERLEVLDSKADGDRATVIFIAHLSYAGEDVSFTEKSFFSRVDGRWLYVNGDVFPGIVRDLRA